MKLKNIAFNNLRRRKSRMIFLIIGMMMGISTIVALSTVSAALEEDVKHKLDEYGANIMIVPRANTLSMSYGGMSIPGAQYDIKEIPAGEVEKIYTIKNKGNLATVSPKLLGATGIDGIQVLIVGADMTSEIKLKKWWKFTEDSNVNMVRTQKPSPVHLGLNMTLTVIEGLEDNHLILGSTIAEKLGKTPGDEIMLNNQDFVVKAVLLKTGSQDDSIVFMDLGKAQEILGKEGKITLIEVAALCGGCPVEEIASQINEQIPEGKATPIKQVVEGRMTTIKQLQNFGMTVGVIVLIIGSLIVFTTMMASVKERVREIGIFRAIGFRRTHVVRIILLEAFTLSLIAGVLGYLVGSVGGLVVGPWIADMTISWNLDSQIALLAIGLSVFIGTIATIYPALKASRIDPAEALRQI